MHVFVSLGAGQVVAFFAVQSAEELRFDAVHACALSAGLAVGFVIVDVNHGVPPWLRSLRISPVYLNVK